jgi:hypothetical protein
MARVIQYLQCAWRAENLIALKCFTVLSCCMCRQVEMLIQELVVLVQRSEEYTYFLTSHMRDAVNRDAEKQQAAAAQRQAHLQRRLSGPQPDTPATRDQKGVHERALVTFQNHVLKCFFWRLWWECTAFVVWRTCTTATTNMSWCAGTRSSQG